MHGFDAGIAEADVAPDLKNSQVTTARETIMPFHFIFLFWVVLEFISAELYELVMTPLTASHKNLIQAKLNKRGSFNWQT